MENDKSSLDRRVNTYMVYGVILAVIFTISVHKTAKDNAVTSLIATCSVTSVFLVVFASCDGLLRLSQILTALIDANQQSREMFWSTMKHHLAMNTASAIVVIIGGLLFTGLMFTVQRCPLNYAWDFGPYVCIPTMMFSLILLKIANMTEWEMGASSLIDAMKGLDYGTGMAYSYYYGYLRLILPSTGTASKSIIEKIENFEDNHNVTFPVHKLFILIPSSGYIPPNLKEASYQWMESAQELEEEQRNRAGNIGRRYHNNAYKIYRDGNLGSNPMYVVVEGATPLLTYYEVQQHNHPESNIYKQYKNEIVMMFYKKLDRILQSEPDTRDLCELIHYNDYENGVKVNIAKVILERISKLQTST